MNIRLSILFIFISSVSLGQSITPYSEAEFPSDKFITKREARTLGTITVNLVQVSPKKETDSNHQCRTWLTIQDASNTIRELSQEMEAVGGCSGYFFPDTQPGKDLIVISKFGDYDGRLLVVNQKGELKDYLGGQFYVSPDNRYLFSNYDSDLSGTTIIDLLKNELLFSGELKQYLADWYYEDGRYYALISEDVITNEEIGQLVFDLSTKTFKEIRTNDKIDSTKKLKVSNDPLMFKNCNCGN